MDVHVVRPINSDTDTSIHEGLHLAFFSYIKNIND